MFKYSEIIKSNIKYKISLIALWTLIGLSLVNIITTILRGFHAGFSFYLTQIFASFSKDYIQTYTNFPKEILIVIITGCTVIPYAICALFYKKRPLFAMIAGGLLVFDSVLYCIDFVVYLMDGSVMFAVDFLIRVGASVVILMYILEGRELWYSIKDADSLEEIFGNINEAEAMADGEIQNVNVRKIVVSRKNETWGFLADCEIIVDGESAGFIKNGQSKTIDVSVSAHQVMVIAQNGSESEAVDVENGRANKVFVVSVKPKLTAPTLPVITLYEAKENN